MSDHHEQNCEKHYAVSMGLNPRHLRNDSEYLPIRWLRIGKILWADMQSKTHSRETETTLILSNRDMALRCTSRPIKSLVSTTNIVWRLLLVNSLGSALVMAPQSCSNWLKSFTAISEKLFWQQNSNDSNNKFSDPFFLDRRGPSSPSKSRTSNGPSLTNLLSLIQWWTQSIATIHFPAATPNKNLNVRWVQFSSSFWTMTWVTFAV